MRGESTLCAVYERDTLALPSTHLVVNWDRYTKFCLFISLDTPNHFCWCFFSAAFVYTSRENRHGVYQVLILHMLRHSC